MKFTLNWLKEHLQTTATLNEIVEKLTAIGLEVESVVDKSLELAEFRIARIIEAQQHPDADRLRVCRVDTGTEELQIVCGAPNARAGINVVLAPVGSIIPNGGFTIKASKIRGVESNGMLCSSAELGLGEDSGGIIELVANDNLGARFVDVAGLSDPVIEIAITPNRGDCLGVYGIARDLAATGIGTLKPLEIKVVQGKFTSPISIAIEDENTCPIFAGRYFRGVKNGESPQWLQNRLKAIGLKPISALVDITNYINFEFGRPLHVYDAAKLSGKLEVSFAKDGEKFKALDNKEYSLSADLLVVRDGNAVQSLGGVIGGVQSGCSLETTDVFLEVALFDADIVTRGGRKLEILTDSRYRFERKVDPEFVMKGVEIASAMIIELCGGEASGPVVAGSEPKWQRSIELPKGFVKKYSGVGISEAEIDNILKNLGFKVSGENIEAPSWRPDVEGAPDLVEEVLRIHGYDNIPMLPLNQLSQWERGGVRGAANSSDLKTPLQRGVGNISKLRRFMAARGLREVVTWSFMAWNKAVNFGFSQEMSGLKIKNPISSELDCMRPSILPNLLDAIRKNSARGFRDLSFFEIGPVFNEATPGGQSLVLTGVLSGKHTPRNVHGGMRDVDVFDAKAEVLVALEKVGVSTSSLQATREAPEYYHPGKSGVVKLGKAVLGVFGELHPSIVGAFGVEMQIMAFEVFLDNIPAPKAKKSTAKAKLEKSDYQSSTRDFAFIIDAGVAASDIIKASGSVDKILIRAVDLFDVYMGKNIEVGKKSIAISIKIQPHDRTLTENELEDLSKKVIGAIEKLGGVLRA
jgi:phenylalanyl-tRNA synthetase beta chain